jgi:hypothetical protein
VHLHVAVVNLTGGDFSRGYHMYVRELMPWLRRQPEITLTIPLPEATKFPGDDAADAQLRWPARDHR